MQVVKSSDNVLIALEDEFTITGPSNRILTSEVIVNKKGSENNGQLATIEAIRNNKVLVTLNNTGEYRTYAFNHLKSSTSTTSSNTLKNSKTFKISKSTKLSKINSTVPTTTRTRNITKTLAGLSSSSKSSRKTKVSVI